MRTNLCLSKSLAVGRYWNTLELDFLYNAPKYLRPLDHAASSKRRSRGMTSKMALPALVARSWVSRRGPASDKVMNRKSPGDACPDAIATDLHRVQLRVWRLALRQLNRSDPQAPDVCLVIISALLDDFRRHPVGRSYEGVLLRGQGAGELTRDTEVGELNIPTSRQKNIGGCKHV